MSTLVALGILAIRFAATLFFGIFFTREWYWSPSSPLNLINRLTGPGFWVFIAIWIIAVWVWALPKKDEELVTKPKQYSDVSEYDA